MRGPSRGTVECTGTPTPQRTSVLGSPDVALTRRRVREMSEEGVYGESRFFVSIASPWGIPVGSKEREVRIFCVEKR